MSIEAMKQALAALVKSKNALEVLWVSHHANRTDYAIEDIESAIKALRTALSQQPVTPEPMKSFAELREKHRAGIDAERAKLARRCASDA